VAGPTNRRRSHVSAVFFPTLVATHAL
jgi:hypothetical protein